MSSNREVPKFVADVMLGSLSRWLRLFGFDTLYSNKINDKELIRISLMDNRILLTRDSSLAKSKSLRKVLLIQSETLKEQLKEVIFFIKDNIAFSKLVPRCAVCNGETVDIDRDAVKDIVPEHILIYGEEFKMCKNCGKVYWSGSHAAGIKKLKEEIYQEILS